MSKENYDEILTEHSKIIKDEVFQKERCYFCNKIDSANYFISIGKFFICYLCWKRFAEFVKEWMEHDVFK